LSSTTAVLGSAITFSVEIRDCSKNDVSNDTLKISLNSSDNNVQINGNNLPYTTQVQNGKTTFSLTSSNAGTYSFIIQDTTHNFTVTNTDNNNPSVTFTNNSSGNSHCTTAANMPNAWYSNVYPASPITVSVGSSAGLKVDVRDCNQNNVSNDMLQISLSSGDNNVQINGNNLPYVVQAQNGEVSFSVTSSNSGTYGFIIKDTTNNFTITDQNNHNPSVVFNSVSTPTPTPTPQPTSIQTPSNTPTPTTSNPAPTQTPTPQPTPAVTSTPSPNPSPT
jgi:hypothetical protein